MTDEAGRVHASCGTVTELCLHVDFGSRCEGMGRQWELLAEDTHLIGCFQHGLAFVEYLPFGVKYTIRVEVEMLDHERIHRLPFE